jgi:hypothetical protein
MFSNFKNWFDRFGKRANIPGEALDEDYGTVIIGL